MTLFSIVVHCPSLLFIGVPMLYPLISCAKISILFKLSTPGLERILVGIPQLAQRGSYTTAKLQIQLYGMQTILV